MPAGLKPEMSPGYRHKPWSQRLGIEFNHAEYWKLEMPDAECFMYFIGSLRQIFGNEDVLVMEGLDFSPEVEKFYQEAQSKLQAQLSSLPAVSAMLRHPKARAYQIPLTRENHEKLTRFAAQKTFAELCDAMLIYRMGEAPEVLMDGRQIGERCALFAPQIKEAALKRFSGGKIRGTCAWHQA